MNEEQAIAILAQVKAKLGRNFKAPIRRAWMYGTYEKECLEEWANRLQQIRNCFGPSWLVNVRVK